MFRKTQVARGVLAALGGAALVSAPAFAQPDQRIEITGSAIRSINAETALPVSIITREDINRTGASNVQELIDRLTANNGGGRALGESIGESSAPGQSGASLRGLGRERTLVLVNGRRLPPYPFSGLGVDLNAVPLSAIQRIEVLRDGASAIYGSDALAGVINFIMRKDLIGGEIAATYEKPSKKGGTTKSVSLGWGFGDLTKDGYNFLATYSLQQYSVIKSSDRDFAKTGNRPDLGIVKDSGNTFPANAFIRSTGAFVPGVSGFPACNPPDSFTGASNCRYDFTSKIDVYPESKRQGAVARATVQVNPDNQLFLEGLYSNNDLKFGISQTPTVTTGKPSYYYPGQSTALPNGGKWYPTAAVDAIQPGYRGDLRISWRIVDGGQRREGVVNEGNRLIFGAEGTLWNFDYKAAIINAESLARQSFLSGQYSDTRLRAALATGLVNPFGPNDELGLATLASAQLSGNERASNTANRGLDFQISRELVKLPAGPLALAVGGDLRKETYLDGYSDLAASGDIVGGSGTAGAVRGTRRATGLFAELAVPIIKGLDGTLALRHDSYVKGSGSSRDGTFSSEDRSANSPKVSLRFQPIPQVLLRASYGKGFRMPALDNLYAPSSFTNSGGNFTDPFYDAIKGCTAFPSTVYCNSQQTVQNNSNPNLKPEKSKQFNLGAVLEPIKGWTTEITYFDIKIENGITALTGDNILTDWFAHRTGPTTSTSVYADRLIIDPATGYLDYVMGSLENIAKEHVAGFDFAMKYTLRTSIGNFTPSWDGTILTKSTQSNTVTGEVVNVLGKYVRGGPAIKQKHKFALDFETGPWVFVGRYDYQGSYDDYSDTRKVKSYGLFDFQTSYKGFKNTNLTFGIRNLTDKKPPISDQQDYFQVGFDPTYADVKGRRFYLSGNYKF